MNKKFNTTGMCIPALHYMVDISDKLHQIIEQYVDAGEYITINRARQYGKSTTLELLYQALQVHYIVIDISFEAADDLFTSMYALAAGFSNKVLRSLKNSTVSPELLQIWQQPISETLPLDTLGERISEFCQKSDKSVVLLIDEVDKASDNQIFLSFLGLLREKYLRNKAGRDYTFKSVILAGVCDIKNMKLRLRPNEEHKQNSPWNIAADFNLDMSFSASDIAGMLHSYEQDHHTGMDITALASEIYDYTAGYPYLVSALCKIMDEQLPQLMEPSTIWSQSGLLRAVKLLLNSSNTLFDDMIKHINEHAELSNMLQGILFCGQRYTYNAYNHAIGIGSMFGFIKNENGEVSISNRIFETSLYDYYLSETMTRSRDFSINNYDKNQFIVNGVLDMDRVMEKFVEYFSQLYEPNDENFVEEYGRKLFLLYLKPIINGTGNYYVEARTRSQRRTDVIVDYQSKQYIIELKIWHGDEYNTRGEQQLIGYLKDYNQTKGWMLSFNFNRHKNIGVKKIEMNGYEIIEAVV